MEVEMREMLDLSGERYGRLTVLPVMERRFNQKGTRTYPYWLCKCDCGKEKFIAAHCLRSGKTVSCGCYQAERVREVRRESRTFAEAPQSCGYNKLYRTYRNMHHRCAEDKRYLDKGITVCDEWSSYETFHKWAMANGYKEGLTIDRINNDGNYSPDNCRWVNQEVQANNTSKNRPITYKGSTRNLLQWSRETGILPNTIWRRLKNGWSVEDALTIAPSAHNKKTYGKKGVV
jgi:hypothetical protein